MQRAGTLNNTSYGCAKKAVVLEAQAFQQAAQAEPGSAGCFLGVRASTAEDTDSVLHLTRVLVLI